MNHFNDSFKLNNCIRVEFTARIMDPVAYINNGASV